MATRAKFKCNGITSHDWGVSLDLSPVMPAYKDGKVDPDDENSKFFKASPSGKIELSVVNPEAAAQFEVGKEYFVDFTPA